MNYTGHDRAVANVVGFLMLLAVVTIAFVMYTTVVAPELAGQAEAETQIDMFEDMHDIRGAIDTAADRDRPTTETIRTNVEYQFGVSQFVHPMRFTIDTGDTASAELTNYGVADSTFHDDQSGDTISYESDRIEFVPISVNSQHDYVGTEHGVPYHRTPDDGAVFGNQVIVNEDVITLQLLDADLQYSFGNLNILVGAEEYDVTEVEPDDDMILELETKVTEDAWHSLLEEERVERGGHITSIQYDERPNETNKVEIHFDADETYDIHITEATVTNR